jgi:hypothetical protein
MADGRETCTAKVCGSPKDVDDAKAQVIGKVSFPGVVPYICDEGYSINGEFDGGTEFYQECEDTGRFGKSKTDTDASVECKPMLCTEFIPKVSNADGQDTTKFTFPEKRLVKCMKGFTTNGAAAGKKKFTTECTSNGRVAGVEACMRVTCGTAPPVARSSFELRAYMYEEKSGTLVNRGILSQVWLVERLILRSSARQTARLKIPSLAILCSAVFLHLSQMQFGQEN